MSHILSLRFNNYEYPVLEVTEKDNQTVVRFIHQESHFTLHLKDKRILFNIWDSKYCTTWSSTKVDIARKLGYKNSDKHGHYIFHGGLIKACNYTGYHLLGHRLYLRKFPKDNKYLKNSTNIGISSIDEPMLYIILSTLDNPYNGESIGKFSIQFGDLFFIIED